MSGVKLLLDSARGIYIPRDFVTGFDLSKFSGIDAADIEACANPESEFYWEAWDDILNNAEHVDEQGHTWRLYQDDDLFALCDELMTVEERCNFLDESEEEAKLALRFHPSLVSSS